MPVTPPPYDEISDPPSIMPPLEDEAEVDAPLVQSTPTNDEISDPPSIMPPLEDEIEIPEPLIQNVPPIEYL